MPLENKVHDIDMVPWQHDMNKKMSPFAWQRNRSIQQTCCAAKEEKNLNAVQITRQTGKKTTNTTSINQKIRGKKRKKSRSAQTLTSAC